MTRPILYGKSGFPIYGTSGTILYETPIFYIELSQEYTPSSTGIYISSSPILGPNGIINPKELLAGGYGLTVSSGRARFTTKYQVSVYDMIGGLYVTNINLTYTLTAKYPPDTLVSKTSKITYSGPYTDGASFQFQVISTYNFTTDALTVAVQQ